MWIIKIIFWLSAGMIIYVWVGYISILFCIKRNKIIKNELLDISPSVTVLIPAFNEEENIRRRIENILESDYPHQRLEIIVSSDGSDDNTEEIVRQLSKSNIRVKLICNKREGKSSAQNNAIKDASGDIIVLTDSDTEFNKRTIRELTKHFIDQKVGCVTGKLLLREDNNSIGRSQNFYWRYETFMRKLESDLGILHTASGAIMAFRKELFIPLENDIGDDCAIPIDIISQNFSNKLSEKAVAYDIFPTSIMGELRARIRMTARNLHCTLYKLRSLVAIKNRLIVTSIISHKILRWFTPIFMLMLAAASIILRKEGFIYKITLNLMSFMVIVGFIGLIGEKIKLRLPFISQVFSFLIANIGFLLGILKYIFGDKIRIYDSRL